jgi:two-component system alkaline phosphatase synthesis response regulator PhoP
MPKTVLVVDDEKDIVDLLTYNLKKEGYNVLTAYNGKQALEQVQYKADGSIPDVVVLDVMMPEYDGWEVCKRLKQKTATASIPVIFLTAKSSEVDEVLGLELGADDYISKPISIRKLLARIRAVLRRKEAEGTSGEREEEMLHVGALEINRWNYTVNVAGQEIFFPKKEFQVLAFLATNRDRVVSRETLLNSIWGEQVYVIDRTVDVHIRKIREKLGVYADMIETVKGVGYRLRTPEE